MILLKRATVVEFIQSGLSKGLDSDGKEICHHHFGRQELRQILDFIYQGEPTCPEEELHHLDKPPEGLWNRK